MTPSSRTIRLFVSSTFRDFGEERQILATQVFPELRRRARERLVEVVEVDLRWGITEEQAERGETLPVCLAEIDRSRPFFIGLLGERYGWTPEARSYPAGLLERHPWLAEHVGGRSVTELEILHGVLNNPAMAGRALFFLRSRDYALARGGDYVSGTEVERERLASLKERIRRSGFAVFEDYADPAALAVLLRDELWQRIDILFPADAVPDAEARESLRHEAQRRSRLPGYGGREEVAGRLEESLRDGCVCLTGTSGVGKSSVIAGWLGMQGVVPEAHLHYAFVGSSPESCRPSGLVRRCWRWLASSMGVAAEDRALPDGGPLFQGFALFLGGLQPQGRRIWVVDAINQLADHPLDDMGWLPDPLPPWLGVLVSCLEGKQSAILARRGYRLIEVPLLGEAARRALALRHLAVHGRSLEEPVLRRLLAGTHMGNPFHLVTVLRELRRTADHHSLPGLVDAILAGGAAGPAGLIRILLERWDAEVSARVRPGLCRDVLSLLEASGGGLSEREIRVLAKASPMEWGYLLGLLEDHLVERAGLLMIGHDLFRGAIRSLWMGSPEEVRALHARLAAHFGMDLAADRSLEMLLPQLAAAGQWAEVLDRLLDIPWVARAVASAGPTEVAGFLDRCPASLQPQARMAGAIQQFAEAPGGGGLAPGLAAAGLLTAVNALDPARRAYEALVAAARRLGDNTLLADGLQALGESEYRRAGREGYQAAESALNEALQLRRALPGVAKESMALLDLALGRVQLSWLRFQEAEDCLARAEAVLAATAGAMDPRVLEAVMLRGITAYWRHLRGVGRWDAARPELLQDAGDLLLQAEQHWTRALERVERGLGATHDEALKLLHYLQEAPYSVGRFELALPWLRRLDDLGDRVDPVQRHACVTALREVAEAAFHAGGKERAMELLAEAERRAGGRCGDDSEPVARVRAHRSRIERGQGGLDEAPVVSLAELPPQMPHAAVCVEWRRIDAGDAWGTGLTGHPWLVDPAAGDVLLVEAKAGLLWRWHPSAGWREPVRFTGGLEGNVLPDWKRGRLLRWQRARDTVHAAPAEGGEWSVLGEGHHDVRGGGPAGWNSVTERPFQFGGYGYFTYKNWWHEFDPPKREWMMIDGNRPGVPPFPRSGQMVPGDTPETVHLFSGEGGETGIQREPRARGGLPIGSMVGWFTWLRDLWRFDLRRREWTCLLPPNHSSIRQEGAYGFNPITGWHVLRGGCVPAAVYRAPRQPVNGLQLWDGRSSQGFQPAAELGEVPPEVAGRWVAVPHSEEMLWLAEPGIWRMRVVAAPAPAEAAAGGPTPGALG
jgi:nephrocystin-3